jgi:hypothetical protein
MTDRPPGAPRALFNFKKDISSDQSFAHGGQDYVRPVVRLHLARQLQWTGKWGLPLPAIFLVVSLASKTLDLRIPGIVTWL